MNKEGDGMDFSDGPAAAEQDHAECQKRIADLEQQLFNTEAALEREQATVACSAKTVKDLRDTIQSLRDELKAHGIGQSLDERLRQLGFVNRADVDGSALSDSAYSLEIAGTLLDFSATCPSHKSLRLSMVTTNVPSCATLWAAKNVYELAQGLRVAESLQLSPASRALFFTNNSPLATTDSFEQPSQDNLVCVMTKLVAACKASQSAFASADFKKLMCLPTYRQAELKLIVAERVRAEIDGKKSLRSDPVIVLGGHNAQMLSDVLGASFVEAPTVPDLRSFFESSHFQAAVQQIFVWLDPDNEQFVLAHQPQLVETLRDIVVAAAKWGQIQFTVLPVPYAASLLPTFNAFMEEFNKISIDLPNVLWLNDAKRVDGARFTHSLGVNAFIADFSTLSKTGRIARRSARAALRFLRELKPSLVPEHMDLSDPPPPQQSTSSSSSSAPALHDVRHGKIQKPYRDHNSSRGGTNKRGGGGGRGKWSNDRQGQGARRH